MLIAQCLLISAVLAIRPPTIAVLGRPNVGKSTIANRLTGQSLDALVHDDVGITRDRIYGHGWWNAHEFRVVDTGGLVFDDDPTQVFMPQIRQQALVALSEANIALMVVDGQIGCTPLDEQIADFLRRNSVPVVLAVNKCESSASGELQAADFWRLGVGTPWPVSGIHGTGMGDLMDQVAELLPPAQPKEAGAEDEDVVGTGEPLRIAIIGKPNVGKSSLLNRLTGSQRAIVSDVAGTTQDVIDQLVTRNQLEYMFLDTAGMRRQARVGKGLEEMMVGRSLKAVKRADVCLLVIDATEGVSDQEGAPPEHLPNMATHMRAPTHSSTFLTWQPTCSPSQHGNPHAHRRGGSRSTSPTPAERASWW